jgi:S-adenosylmethionine hydrolase
VLRDRGFVASAPGRWPIPRGAPVRAVSLTNPRYRLPEVSATFHGRDVFAPAAAHLSRGVPLDDLGEPIGDLYLLSAPTPICRGGKLVGRVVHVDHFGNLVTSLRPADLAGLQPVQLVIRGHVVGGLRRFYAEGTGLGAVVGSAGLVELALPGGSAAAALGASVGDEVIARRSPGRDEQDRQDG